MKIEYFSSIVLQFMKYCKPHRLPYGNHSDNLIVRNILFLLYLQNMHICKSTQFVHQPAKDSTKGVLITKQKDQAKNLHDNFLKQVATIRQMEQSSAFILDGVVSASNHMQQHDHQQMHPRCWDGMIEKPSCVTLPPASKKTSDS